MPKKQILVYQQLRRLAACKMANKPPRQTLQPTALVHEAWLRLAGSDQQTWQNRAHFFGAAAAAMRRILIESTRRKRALRHGGGQHRAERSGSGPTCLNAGDLGHHGARAQSRNAHPLLLTNSVKFGIGIASPKG